MGSSLTPIEGIEDILRLNRMCPMQWSGHRLTAKLRLQAAQRVILDRLNESDAVEIEVRLNGRLITLAAAAEQCVEIAIAPPRGSQHCLAKDEEDLLAVFNLHCLPEHFALIDSGYKSWSVKPEKNPASVIIASCFIKQLEHNSILEVTGTRFTLMTYDQKIYLTYGVNATTVLRTADVVARGLEKLEDMLSDTLHGAEKKRLIRNAMISSLKSCEESNRLSHLLSHCDEILENAQNNYELFISNFSFNNDLDKLNEQKREFSVKLNGLLIGIQGKLLAIPVSTILATTQLKEPTDNIHLTINCTVMASSLFFLTIIVWLIKSQVIAIKAIRYEIVQKEKRFRHELPKLFAEVATIFDSLKSDCNLNLKMAWSLTVLSFVLTAITGYVFLVKTPEVMLVLQPLLDWASGLLTGFVSEGAKIISGLLTRARPI
ncbi:hypothetical protein PPRCHA0_5112 [Pseudomonas protegens CHA0]|uniref:Uncharacterized protein n=1 Tax=Pseudomonas protegens (strain DSM 19095 / LMG 27888 / CFBP 6595 / CHA0) TaxID=1124983 RepID=A0A2C9ET92_PSEPH|nr:hypothetical protein PFLCHA0_c51500 [Pseudomonas protegens CHA0]RLO24549.1 hypothetical protein EAG75_02680 [Pseudomonas protegens]VAV71414.1 hypothetical protein PPRCHA0_5112 [Pseudomonas protegens CHA0]